jgi:hypothetical protein
VTVADEATSVAGVTELHFAGGASVADAGGGRVDVTVAGGDGGAGAEVRMGSQSYAITGTYAPVQPAGQAPLRIELPSAGWYTLAALLSVQAGVSANDDIRAKLVNVTDSADIVEVRNGSIAAGDYGQLVLLQDIYVGAAKTIGVWVRNATASRGSVVGIQSTLQYTSLSAASSVPTPYISSFSPTSGPSAAVVITGTGLTGVTAVKFGGTDAVSFTVDSDTQITATSPASFTDGPVTVTTAAGTAGSVSSFAQFAGFTKLLLHFDGSSGATTTTDSSIYAHTVTLGGGAALTSAQSAFGSASLAGAGSTTPVAQIPDSEDWAFGTGDFTVDFWFRWGSTPGITNFFSQVYEETGTYQQFAYNPTAGHVGFGNNISEPTVDNTGFSPTVGHWYHFALVRNDNTWYIFIDGIQFATASMGLTLPDVAGSLCLGGIWNWPSNTYVDEFRISKGVARWTTNFIPPVMAHAAD